MTLLTSIKNDRVIDRLFSSNFRLYISRPGIRRMDGRIMCVAINSRGNTWTWQLQTQNFGCSGIVGIIIHQDLSPKIKSLYFNGNWFICAVGMKLEYTISQQWSITLSSKQNKRRSMVTHSQDGADGANWLKIQKCNCHGVFFFIQLFLPI